jgi:GT2 family glycosyltransferase
MAKEKDSQESDLQKLFEEEIKKPYYRVNYLDSFNLPYEKLDVSVIIVTYNRCPYKPGTLKEDHNPLVWGIKSALIQKPSVKEIIIADDLSEDYTEIIVKKYQKYAMDNNLPPVIYKKTDKRKGISAIRNFGGKCANGKYIMFFDDDAFLSPYAVFGAVYTFEELEKKGMKVGAINLPTYGRSSIPRATLPKREIGVIDYIRGRQSANKDCFPLEYVSSKEESGKFLNQELQILNPFPIANLNTIALIPKKVFEEVGGFPEHFTKRMEDREFGCRLIENGYQLYYQPDPKFQCVHGSYGLKTGKKFTGEDWFKKIDKSISMKKAMEVCDNTKENTGSRIKSPEFLSDYILSFFCLIYERNKKGAIHWIKRVYKEFVEQGKTDLFGNANIPIPTASERERMWKRAIDIGLKIIKEKEKESLKKINETLLDIKKNKRPTKIIDFLERLNY